MKKIAGHANQSRPHELTTIRLPRLSGREERFDVDGAAAWRRETEQSPQVFMIVPQGGLIEA